MKPPVALIVGAGVGGLSVAWWLNRIGWRSIVIERAGNLRMGGYMMSLSGPGFEAAQRMGLIEDLQTVRHRGGESVYHDRHGRVLLRLKHGEFMKDFPYLVLRRTDLVHALAERVKAFSEIRLATEATTFEQRSDGVSVTLSDGTTIDCDLVVAADGINSATREAAVVSGNEVLKPLGYRFATYDVADTLNLGANFLSYADPGRISEYYKISDGRLAALHIWTAGPERTPVSGGFAEVRRIFAGDHPQTKAIIDAGESEGRPPMVDDMLLVEAPSWSKGRVVLAGDAAHSISLMSGQGAGMAMTGAAVLAEELHRHANIGAALSAYETRMRVPVEKLQARSRSIARWFVPRTKFAFHFRNLVLRNMPSRMLANYFKRSLQSDILAASGVVLPSADRAVEMTQGSDVSNR